MRGRSEEVDDFGFDPIYDAKLKPVLDFLYTKYFRVETSGIDERARGRGRCLLVANHSGTLPLDGVMLKAAVKREHAAPRDVRWLTEDFIYHMPYLGSAMNRLGAVRACQENAERLLAKEQLVAVFPEGVKGIGKLFAERYRLQRFGRGGFIKLCLRTGTPIVPVAVVGAEETNPLLFKIEHLSKALGVPYVPVTPTFPLLGPLGLLPAPTKWRIQFGEPLDLSSHGPEAADDEILVGKLAERVRATIQGMLDRAVGSTKERVLRLMANCPSRRCSSSTSRRGPTSHDVVAKLRRALRTRAVGHCGTLDPMATGVLVVAVEDGTKLVPWLTADDKTYEATIRLGIATDSLDADGVETARGAARRGARERARVARGAPAGRPSAAVARARARARARAHDADAAGDLGDPRRR